MIEQDDFTMIVFALRYSANRLSYAPGLACRYIMCLISKMSEQQREKMLSEVESIISLHEYADKIALAELMKLKSALKQYGEKE